MCPDLPCPARAIVDGDATHKPISAASILAKTARDAEMCALHDRFPQYGFDQHKGYATAEHLEAVGRLGPCEIHRSSFRSVAVFFQGNLFSMAESLRVRGYRLYCEAMKLSNAVNGPGRLRLPREAPEARVRRRVRLARRSVTRRPREDPPARRARPATHKVVRRMRRMG